MAAEPRYVFDSSAVIAMITGELGAAAVRQRAFGAAISAMNLAEVATVLMRRGSGAAETERTLRGLPVDVLPWTDDLVYNGLDLAPLARTHGLSLADRACLTLARALDRTALTGDTVWQRAVASMHANIAVELFR